MSFSLILADISSIYPFSEKSELAKTAENDYLAQKTTFCITITYNYIKDFKIANTSYKQSESLLGAFEEKTTLFRFF